MGPFFLNQTNECQVGSKSPHQVLGHLEYVCKGGIGMTMGLILIISSYCFCLQ